MKKYRKIVSIIMTFVFVVILTSGIETSVYSDYETPWTPEILSVEKVDEGLKVNIGVIGDLSSFEMRVYYEEDTLVTDLPLREVVKADVGFDFLVDAYVVTNIEAENYVVFTGAETDVRIRDYEGAIGSVLFKDECSITITDGLSGRKLMDYEVKDPANTDISNIILGDINKDEKLNAQDALLILKHITGVSKELQEDGYIAADVNRDGVVNAIDVYEILRYSAPLIDLNPGKEDVSYDIKASIGSTERVKEGIKVNINVEGNISAHEIRVYYDETDIAINEFNDCEAGYSEECNDLAIKIGNLVKKAGYYIFAGASLDSRCKSYSGGLGYMVLEKTGKIMIVNGLTGDKLLETKINWPEENTPEPTEIPTEVPEVTVGPDTKLGDVNCDNSIDAADALCVLKHAAVIEKLNYSKCTVADVTKDYNVDAQDALQILKLAAKIITEF